MLGIRIDEQFAVDPHPLVPDLDAITRQADHPLDEILRLIFGVFEHDDVAALRLRKMDQDLVHERQLDIVEELGDEDVVADGQCRDHRPGRDFEGLNDKRADKERQHDGDDDRLEVLTPDGFGGNAGLLLREFAAASRRGLNRRKR